MSRDMTRQSGLVDRETLQNTVAYVIGLGAVGHTLSKLLANLGVGGLVLNDFDDVERVNLATQGYIQNHVGYPKTLSTLAEILRSLGTESSDNEELSEAWENLDYDPASGRLAHHVYSLSAGLLDGYDLGTALAVHHAEVEPRVFHWFGYFRTGVVFSCVDTMLARREAFAAAQTVGHTRWFVDCRMAGFTLRVVTVDLHDADDRERYLQTLVTDEEAHPGTCTTRGTLYSASIIAGIAVSQAVLALHAGLPAHARDIVFNLAVMELISNGNPDPVGAGAST